LRSGTGNALKILSTQEYETIDSIMAQNSDILDSSTVGAWDTRNTIRTAVGVTYFQLQCEAFWADVRSHYERYKLNAVPPPTS